MSAKNKKKYNRQEENFYLSILLNAYIKSQKSKISKVEWKIQKMRNTLKFSLFGGDHHCQGLVVWRDGNGVSKSARMIGAGTLWTNTMWVYSIDARNYLSRRIPICLIIFDCTRTIEVRFKIAVDNRYWFSAIVSNFPCCWTIIVLSLVLATCNCP